MVNLRKPNGRMVTILAPTGGTVSGTPVVLGNLFGVAANTVAAGLAVEIDTLGVYTFPKDASTFAQGASVYWNNTSQVATSVSNGNIRIGVAALVQADGTAYPGALTGDATVDVRLNQSFGAGTDFMASVSLTAANLIAMNATPVNVIPAPGAGMAIVVDSILFEMTTTSTQFTGGGAVSFPYHGGSVATHAGSIPAATVTTTAGTTDTLLGPATATNGTVVPANTGVDITNATAGFAAGTGTAKVQVKYRIITL